MYFHNCFLAVIPNYFSFAGNPVPPYLQVLITLACMASGSHQVLIGECYEVSQAKVSQCLSQVSKAIARLSIRYIQFPTMDGVYKDMNSFKKIGGMPNFVGCIDCTHFKIAKPRRNDRNIQMQ